MVGIAQSVERLVVVQKVAGSNPVTHPNEETYVERCGSLPHFPRLEAMGPDARFTKFSSKSFMF